MIESFRGEHRFLSNFGEGGLWFRGYYYESREGAYQAAKLLPDIPDYEAIRTQYQHLSGREAKLLSKELKHLTRPDWQEHSLPAMCEVVHAFFIQHKDMRILLVNTFPHDLVEGNNWHDDFWGVCSCGGKKPHCGEGLGKNWLGRILQAERMFWLDLMSNKSWEGSNVQTNQEMAVASQAAA